jgi:hypothetical protein
MFVGGALLALLFVFDFFSPKATADLGIHSGGDVDRSTVRIRSEQKWPERVVFDTAQTAIVAKPAQTQTAQVALPTPALAPAAAPEISPKARVRETFAQFVPVEPKKADPPVQKKRKVVARDHSRDRYHPVQPVRVARYGFFGPSMW